MRNDPQVIDLVTRARNGERSAWEALVERYSPLVWSICRRWQLDRTDAEDVGQAVWLRLLEHLDYLRDPAALPGWLATTTKRECYQVQDAAYRSAHRQAFGESVLDLEDLPDRQSPTAEEELIVAERHAALREAFGDLPLDCQRLLALLIADPPVPYAEISSRLGIAVGSIGPYRSRSLDRLRRHPAIAALMDTEAAGSPRGLSSLAVAAASDQTGSMALIAVTDLAASNPAVGLVCHDRGLTRSPRPPHRRLRRADRHHLPDPRRGAGHAQRQRLPGNRNRRHRSVAGRLTRRSPNVIDSLKGNRASSRRHARGRAVGWHDRVAAQLVFRPGRGVTEQTARVACGGSRSGCGRRACRRS